MQHNMPREGFDASKWNHIWNNVNEAVTNGQPIPEKLVYVMYYNAELAPDQEITVFTDVQIPTSLTQEQAAQALGKSQSGIANKLRLLKHSDGVLEALRQGELTERHARALLRLPTERQKLDAIDTILRMKMNVSRAEQYIASLLEHGTPKPPKPNVAAFIRNLTQSLSKIQNSGIPAVSERRETENEIVVTITFPKG